MNILNLLLGLCTGIVVGLTGAGGGILAIPALVMGGMDMLAAKPVALLAVTMGAALGAVAGLRQGLVRYRAALYMSALGVVFSPVGSWLALRVSQSWLAVLFSGVLLLVAWRSWRLAGRQVPQGAVEKQTDTQAKPCQVDAGSGRFIWQPACFGALGLIGSVAGLMSGMLGVGGGFVVVPMLQRYTNLRYHSVVLTSLAVIALVSAFSALQLIAQGAQFGAGGWVFMASTTAGVLAARLWAQRIPQSWLQRGFALLVLLSMVLLLLKTFYPNVLGF
ncbi:MAG: sulfite exporter TauE/SafE family protein [Brachymonas sp.]|jgi:uncharacterized membrane protein YfcA|nr:sulfite exporter TauE/SafE family protein [Brachymonas sp.]MBP6139265.1 sulfite exporter TauE/SafE family protein [Brachymonas sp.]MBP7247093.1 sulfite exporter TauE/SafE family protein [Brachymonas sp.]MBP7740482.1 sulfite exporter TauE/SafE family protein [Brachymonas sp.]MBP8597353.1 sulfite exporter TauE/SafE family protein [Brachymonas sp.]